MDLTLAVALTAGGAVGFAGLIKGLISLFKVLPGVGGAITTKQLEPVIALALSAAVVIFAAVNAVTLDPTVAGPEFYFGAFLAWYGIARLSMAIHDDIAQNPNSLTGIRLGGFKMPEQDNEPPAKELTTVKTGGEAPAGPPPEA